MGEYIKRLTNGTSEISHDDLNLIFEKVDPKHTGKVEVTAFLKKVEENEYDESHEVRELRLMKEYLESHVAKKREELANSTVAEVERIKKMRSVDNEMELLHVAMGTKTLGHDVPVDAYNEVLNDLFQQSHSQEIGSEQNRFARYLRYSNLKLSNVPFYHMRKHELDASKERAVMLHQQLDNPSMLGRLQELEKSRWRSSLSTINSYFDEDPRSSTNNNGINNNNTGNRSLEKSKSSAEFASGEVKTGALALSQSLPNLTLSPSPLVNSGREKLAPLSNDKPEKTKEKAPSKPRNLLLDSQKGLSIDDNSSVNSATADGLETNSSKSSSPEKRALKSLRQKTILFQRPEEFNAPISSQLLSSSYKGRPSSVGAESRSLSSATKHKVLEELSDNSRQHGGTYYQVNSEDKRFLTTNAKFYPEVIYEPSKPPRRDIISEAETDAQKREYRRQQRYARKEANLEVTRVRLEYEDLNRQVMELNRMSAKNEDKIRYQTHILLQDLRSYKQIPFERAGRRKNLALSDKIFGGQLDKQTTGVVPENRDFHTTYSASFTKDAFNNTN